MGAREAGPVGPRGTRRGDRTAGAVPLRPGVAPARSGGPAVRRDRGAWVGSGLAGPPPSLLTARRTSCGTAPTSSAGTPSAPWATPTSTRPPSTAWCAEGVAFTHAYCQAPICTPSRASFLTGKYPSTLHVNTNGNDPLPAPRAPGHPAPGGRRLRLRPGGQAAPRRRRRARRSRAPTTATASSASPTPRATTGPAGTTTPTGSRPGARPGLRVRYAGEHADRRSRPVPCTRPPGAPRRRSRFIGSTRTGSAGRRAALDAQRQLLRPPPAVQPALGVLPALRPRRAARAPLPRARPGHPGRPGHGGGGLPVRAARTRTSSRRAEIQAAYYAHDRAPRPRAGTPAGRPRRTRRARAHADRLHQRPRRGPRRPRPDPEGLPLLRRPGARAPASSPGPAPQGRGWSATPWWS